MKILDPVELSEKEGLGISDLFAMQQTWRAGEDIFRMDHPRAQNAFLYFAGISGRYRLPDGRTIDAPRGSVVLLPEGSMYTLSTRDPVSTPHTLLLEFRLFDREPIALGREVEVLFSAEEDGRVAALMQKFVAEYAMLSRPYLKLHRDLFAILAILAAQAESKRISLRGFKTIEKGILYLQNDEHQKLTIREIAEMCYVSPAYFRRLFHAYAGMSPNAWRTRRRIEQAKVLMERSALSVAELSDLLGYDDPSYFCRVFKKEVGMSPSAYQKTLEPYGGIGGKHE